MRMKEPSGSERLAALGAMMVLSLSPMVGCERDGPASAEADEASSEAGAARDGQPADAVQAEPLSPAARLAMAGARLEVVDAQRQAFRRASSRALLELRGDGAQVEASRRPELGDAGHLAVLFSANNHGEREDCGCRRNPLGGLGRRATLIDWAGRPEAAGARKYWGSGLEAPDGTLIVDAGDGLFKRASLMEAPEAQRDRARANAEAVIAALNVAPPDVANVGVLDLALGWERFEELRGEADFPFVSLNLRHEGEAPLPGHLILERGGLTIAVVGVLKQDPRIKGYYKNRGLEVVDPVPIWPEAAGAQGVDFVVLLSNEGIGRTQELLERLEEAGRRVDAAIVSNTNQLTSKPRWHEGTPMLEPMSRGKYFGRLDVWLSGERAPAWANATSGQERLRAEYRRAWGNYLSSRYGVAQLEEQLAQLELEQAQRQEQAAQADAASGAEAGEGAAAKVADKLGQRAARRRTWAQRQLPTRRERVELTWREVDRLREQLRARSDSAAPEGDDWLEARVVPVKIEIEQAPKVRRVLDRYKKD